MKKDTKNILWLLGAIIVLSNPSLLVLFIIGYIIYLANKGKKFNSAISNIKEKYKNSDKTHNYEVIDTTAEVIDSEVISTQEWTATKEYKH